MCVHLSRCQETGSQTVSQMSTRREQKPTHITTAWQPTACCQFAQLAVTEVSHRNISHGHTPCQQRLQLLDACTASLQLDITVLECALECLDVQCTVLCQAPLQMRVVTVSAVGWHHCAHTSSKQMCLQEFQPKVHLPAGSAPALFSGLVSAALLPPFVMQPTATSSNNRLFVADAVLFMSTVTMHPTCMVVIVKTCFIPFHAPTKPLPLCIGAGQMTTVCVKARP